MKKLNILILVICLLIPMGFFAQDQIKVKKTIPEKALEKGLRHIIIYQQPIEETGKYQWRVYVAIKGQDGIKGDIAIKSFWNTLTIVQKNVIWGFIRLCIKGCLGIADVDLIGNFSVD